MAAIAYRSSDAKQSFIYENLLKDLLYRYRGSSKPVSRLARMRIFPFIDTDGSIKITSLTDGNKPWFFLSDSNHRVTSRSSYKILADEVLSPDLKNLLIEVVGTRYLRQYDINSILKDIVSQMSPETDYSAVWWAKATEIYELWDGASQPTAPLDSASENIDTDYFLFRPSYCDPKYSKMLLNLGVFRDILTHPVGKNFFEFVKAHPGKNPHVLLQLLGIPTSFVNSQGECCTYLRRLFLGIRDNIYFPLSDVSEQEQALCELSHYITFSVIQNENSLAFSRLLQNESFHAGIVVRNRRNSYIPISYSLFYQPRPVGNQSRIDMTDDVLESLHVDEHVYETSNQRNTVAFWSVIHAHPLDNSLQFAPNYRFGNIRITDGQYYRWIWHYAPDVYTARLILGWLTNRGHSFVDDRDRPLAMEVIRMMLSAPPMESDRSFGFRLGSSVKDAARDAALINRLPVHATLHQIHIVVTDCVNKYETVQLKAKLTRAIVAKPAIINGIKNDRIWDNIYSTEALKENKYVIAWTESETNLDLADEPILIVSSESVEKCVLLYIGQKYRIDVSKIDLSGKNYQQDFRDLVFDIRRFVSATREFTSVQPVDNSTIMLNDIKTGSDEIKLWHELMTSREVIWNSDKPSPNTDYNVFSLESFLKRTYRGHCQICGHSIPNDVPEEQYSFMLSDKPQNTFAQALHNLLCLCPTCHSDLRMGYGRRDLSSIARMANQYIAQIEQQTENDHHSGTTIISRFSNRNRFSEGFAFPIMCEICANGKEERIFFSWEHFMRISLVFYNPEQDYQYSGEIGNLMQLLRMLSV